MSLQIGDKAPIFEGKDQNGSPLSLTSLQGKKVVLYFYPKDSTPGCTAQACNLRDNYEHLLANNFHVIGVSADDEKSHLKFIEKYELPFPLLADTDKTVCEQYGVWQEKTSFGKTSMGIVRTTFVIDENGLISDIIKKVNTKEHTNQLINE
jgi:thioredoxin-dependent peroxiredoxin